MYIFHLVRSFVCLVPLLTFAADSPVLKKVPATSTSPASGSDMFKQYCASCHGVDATGHGPAVPALKVPPPDLTLLARNHHGKYPEMHVYATIRGDVNVPAHGSVDMPVWGAIFQKMSGGGFEAELPSGLRMRNLSVYIESLQRK